ncbi:MAG: MTAP family purine nucleoside phosphorylase [Eubacteriales bacterium]|nr:MTAP family purine nucleoside phosphorylase [Eubacteriales bacterium]
MKFAIIGGRSTYRTLFDSKSEIIDTPYGSAAVDMLTEDGRDFVFLSRHGFSDSHDARDTNYRANIYALKMLGVTDIVSISSVGTCDYAHKLGTFCLINDFIDFTHDREDSFRREDRVEAHAGMEDAFDPRLNDALEHLIQKFCIPYAGRVIYACANGPRFETASEVRMMRMLGAQVLGMALVPEVSLARELGMRYASIGVICNYATGISIDFTDQSIDQVADDNKETAFAVAKELIKRVK